MATKQTQLPPTTCRCTLTTVPAQEANRAERKGPSPAEHPRPVKGQQRGAQQDQPPPSSTGNTKAQGARARTRQGGEAERKKAATLTGSGDRRLQGKEAGRQQGQTNPRGPIPARAECRGGGGRRKRVGQRTGARRRVPTQRVASPDIEHHRCAKHPPQPRAQQQLQPRRATAEQRERSHTTKHACPAGIRKGRCMQAPAHAGNHSAATQGPSSQAAADNHALRTAAARPPADAPAPRKALPTCRRADTATTTTTTSDSCGETGAHTGVTHDNFRSHGVTRCQQY
jgi:hypothetical protein